MRSSSFCPSPVNTGQYLYTKIAHDEAKGLYNECQAVETALRNQIIEAIDD